MEEKHRMVEVCVFLICQWREYKCQKNSGNMQNDKYLYIIHLLSRFIWP